MANYSGEFLRSVQFFIGVVEDRNDPLNLGRLRVRAFGIHSDSLAEVPVASLPWATPLMPMNCSSQSGIGHSPTGPVEGTWCFGFFADGQELQQPFIMGTMYGAPNLKEATGKGFQDPLGVYPKEKYLNQSGVNKLARGDSAYGEESLAIKNRDRITDVPVAVPPQVPSVRDLEGPAEPKNEEINAGPKGSFYYRHRWNEPVPRYGGQGGGDTEKENSDPLDYDNTQQPWEDKKNKDGSEPSSFPNASRYPFNHTYTTESGHVKEFDDTPEGERIHEYHTSGTFCEIHPSGSKTTKVVGDEYEIIMKGKHVLVKGHMNLTVQGDARVYVQGNRYDEVAGDYHINVHGDMITKIQGNEQKVVMTDKATQINGNERKRITKNNQKTIEGTNEEKIVGTSNTTHSANVFINTNAWKRDIIRGSLTLFTGANCNITVGSNNLIGNDSLSFDGGGLRQNSNTGRLNISTLSNVNIETAASFNLDTSAEMDLNIGTNYDLTTGGTYKKKITGAAHETYQSTYFVKYVGQNEFDHAGVWKEMKGSDKYVRHNTGVDYSCPTDPSRTSNTNCDDLATPATPVH